MKLQIQSIHFDADQKLLDYIQKKCDKLDQFFDRILDGQVYLKVERRGDHSLKSVEIKVNVPGNPLLVKDESFTFEEATDSVTDKLKEQLKRYKERMRT